MPLMTFTLHRGHLCPYKYFLSSSPHFHLLKFLLEVPKREVVQRDSACTMACGGFFTQNTTFTTSKPPLSFPSICVGRLLFVAECG